MTLIRMRLSVALERAIRPFTRKAMMRFLAGDRNHRMFSSFIVRIEEEENPQRASGFHARFTGGTAEARSNDAPADACAIE